jgi:hypothetical protein
MSVTPRTGYRVRRSTITISVGIDASSASMHTNTILHEYPEYSWGVLEAST